MGANVAFFSLKAEGTPQMVSHNALLCPAGEAGAMEDASAVSVSHGALIFFDVLAASDGPKEKKVSLLLPEFFVAGSARASVSVLGQPAFLFLLFLFSVRAPPPRPDSASGSPQVT